MEENVQDMGATLSPREASDTVSGLGWRYVLGLLQTSVQVQSLAQAIDVATPTVAASGPDADEHLWSMSAEIAWSLLCNRWPRPR